MRTRGFEKVSYDQYEKDFLSIWSHEDEFRYDHVQNSYEMITLPKRSTAKSAGYDFVAPFGFLLMPNEEIKIPLGIKAYMLDSEALFLLPRSGHGFKYYVRLANTLGLGDSDYYNNKDNEGHYWLKIRNEGDKIMSVEVGDKVCQGVFMPYLIVDNDDFEGEVRKGGLGHTGN